MMRKLLLFAMIAALCGGALAYAQSTPVDHPGICPAIERDWRQVAGGSDLAAMDRVIERMGPCPNLRAEARRTRAEAARRLPPAPQPDVCAAANSAWVQLRRSTDRRALQSFIAETPAQCGVRREAQSRLDGLPRETVTRPPNACATANSAWAYLRRSTDRDALQDFITETPAQCDVRREAQSRLDGLPQETASPPAPIIDPCDAAATSWASLSGSSDIARLERFVSDTPATCNTRALAEARLAELRRPPAPQTFRDCPECPEMVRIPGGTFTMGAMPGEVRYGNEPQRDMTVSAFAVSKYELTRAQWATFVRDTRRPDPRVSEDSQCNWRNAGFTQDDSHPVTCVSWEDAQAYVRWLSRHTGQRYRLLTEVEWEYAARGGTTTAFSTGDRIELTEANFSGWLGRTQPVGSYAANSFGLHDMHGNVAEWVEDCGSAQRLCHLRGGSWLHFAEALRSADRDVGPPSNRRNTYGIRIARAL